NPNQLAPSTDEEGHDNTILALQPLSADIAPRYADRQGGYTRIREMGPRRGDGAPLVNLARV
ncbi:L17 family ribosomal protein, partial [Planococcus sp. SIMBA_143]